MCLLMLSDNRIKNRVVKILTKKNNTFSCVGDRCHLIYYDECTVKWLLTYSIFAVFQIIIVENLNMIGKQALRS